MQVAVHDRIQIGHRDLYSQLAQDIGTALSEHQFPPSEIPPSCSFGTVRIVGDAVELSLVGDVFLAVFEPDTLLDNPYFGRREAAAVRQRRTSSTDCDTVLSSDDRLSIAARRARYIVGADGKYVLSSNPKVYRGVEVRTIVPSPGVTTILLCTDGFARLLEPYRLYNQWRSIYDVARKDGLETLVAELRAHEAAASSRSRMHYKASDDACALLLRIHPE